MATSRVTITVDTDVLASVQAAVERGEAQSVSSWIAGAMVRRHDEQERLAALSALIREYEADFGEITECEIAKQREADEAATLRPPETASVRSSG